MLDRLVNIALPRVRDFRGVSPKSFDGRGNYTLGVREQLIFPEINYDQIDKIRGMEFTFVTSAKNDEKALALLGILECPLERLNYGKNKHDISKRTKKISQYGCNRCQIWKTQRIHSKIRVCRIC
jgi:hypothetical protein